jgi:YD repeat-containing protein
VLDAFIIAEGPSVPRPVRIVWHLGHYDAASQLKGIKRYADSTGTQLVAATEYNYDLAGRLQDLTHRQANNTTIAPYTLAYDAADRLTQVTVEHVKYY